MERIRLGWYIIDVYSHEGGHMKIGSSAPLAALVGLFAIQGAVPTVAAAQSGGDGFIFGAPRTAITVYGGFAAPRASSDLWQFSMQELTLGKSDFLSGTVGGDIAIRLADRFDVVLGVSSSSSTSHSEFRDWVDNNDLPIEQVTTFRRVPITASLRYYPFARGQRVGSIAWIPTRFVPFASVGVGTMSYRFDQVGDFIDYGTLDVFPDRYESKGRTGLAQGSVGASYGLTNHLQLTGELRYLSARGRLSGDFQGFKPLDLSGASSSVGLTLRF